MTFQTKTSNVAFVDYTKNLGDSGDQNTGLVVAVVNGFISTFLIPDWYSNASHVIIQLSDPKKLCIQIISVFKHLVFGSPLYL